MRTTEQLFHDVVLCVVRDGSFLCMAPEIRLLLLEFPQNLSHSVGERRGEHGPEMNNVCCNKANADVGTSNI